MASNIGERYKVIPLVNRLTSGVNPSTMTSFGIDLANIHRVSILAGLQQPYKTMDAAASYQAATAAMPCTVTVRVGPATDPATAALGGAQINVGMTARGVLNRWDSVAIYGNLTSGLTTGKDITIDGVTFTLQSTSSAASKHIINSDATAFVESLRANLTMWCPTLTVSAHATATDAAWVRIERKSGHGPISVNIDGTLAADTSTAGCILPVGLAQTGVISFTPADVVATNSSYTHFSVRLESTGNADQQFSAMAVLELKDRAAPNCHTTKIGVAT